MDQSAKYKINLLSLFGLGSIYSKTKQNKNLDSVLKSRDITLLTEVHIVKAMVFPVVMYGCESWTIQKAEHWRIDVFELWCWRRLLWKHKQWQQKEQQNLQCQGQMVPTPFLALAGYTWPHDLEDGSSRCQKCACPTATVLGSSWDSGGWWVSEPSPKGRFLGEINSSEALQEEPSGNSEPWASVRTCST